MTPWGRQRVEKELLASFRDQAMCGSRWKKWNAVAAVIPSSVQWFSSDRLPHPYYFITSGSPRVGWQEDYKVVGRSYVQENAKK